MIHTNKVFTDVPKLGDGLNRRVGHEVVLIAIFFPGGIKCVSRVISSEGKVCPPVFINHFLQVGKGARRAVLVCSLNGSIVDHVLCKKCGCDGAKTKVFPMDLLSKEEVGVIWSGISQIDLRIAEKKVSVILNKFENSLVSPPPPS